MLSTALIEKKNNKKDNNNNYEIRYKKVREVSMRIQVASLSELFHDYAHKQAKIS